MYAPIIFPSALEYWLKCSSLKSPKYVFNPFLTNSSSHLTNEPIEKDCLNTFIQRNLLTTPVHILVPDASMRHNGSKLQCHVGSGIFPRNSFIILDDAVVIASPEMCFLQAASILSIQELVVLACNLCSIYVKDQDEVYGQRRRGQITSVSAISAFLEKVKGFPGTRKAKIAIKYASDRSNSPMESKLAALACLPIHYGGYALRRPKLNHDINLSDEGVSLLGRKTCCGDMVWEEYMIDVEYDSNISHLEINQHAYDKARLNAMTMSGYQVISITANQLHSLFDMDKVFFAIRKALNMPTRKERFDKYRPQRLETVRNILYGRK